MEEPKSIQEFDIWGCKFDVGLRFLRNLHGIWRHMGVNGWKDEDERNNDQKIEWPGTATSAPNLIGAPNRRVSNAIEGSARKGEAALIGGLGQSEWLNAAIRLEVEGNARAGEFSGKPDCNWPHCYRERPVRKGINGQGVHKGTPGPRENIVCGIGNQVVKQYLIRLTVWDWYKQGLSRIRAISLLEWPSSLTSYAHLVQLRGKGVM